MANDRFLFSNDTGGTEAFSPKFDEQTFVYNPQVSETSACTDATSAQLVPLFVAKANGHIVDYYVAVAQTAVSASGFVSGYVTGNVRINSAQCLSTVPSIVQAAASASNARSRTNNSLSSVGTTVSAVINTASSVFSAGDAISIDYGVLSVGSAAAGLAFTGLTVGCTARYYAS